MEYITFDFNFTDVFRTLVENSQNFGHSVTRMTSNPFHGRVLFLLEPHGHSLPSPLPLASWSFTVTLECPLYANSILGFLWCQLQSFPSSSPSQLRMRKCHVVRLTVSLTGFRDRMAVTAFAEQFTWRAESYPKCGWHHSMLRGPKLLLRVKQSEALAFISSCFLRVEAEWPTSSCSYCHQFPAMTD